MDIDVVALISAISGGGALVAKTMWDARAKQRAQADDRDDRIRDELWERVGKLEARIDALLEQIGELTTKIGELESERGARVARIEELERDVERQRRKIAALREERDSLIERLGEINAHPDRAEVITTNTLSEWSLPDADDAPSVTQAVRETLRKWGGEGGGHER